MVRQVLRPLPILIPVPTKQYVSSVVSFMAPLSSGSIPKEMESAMKQ